MMTAKEFLESLPESITGPKNDKEYPRKNVEWFTDSFKKNPDGTIDIKHIRSAVAWTLACLYRDGFLTIKPLAVIASEKKRTNKANETSEWISIETFLDKSKVLSRDARMEDIKREDEDWLQSLAPKLGTPKAKQGKTGGAK